MSLNSNINLGVHAPIGDAGRVNIQAKTDTSIHSSTAPYFKPLETNATTDMYTINERSLVFHCTRSSDRQVRLAARDSSNGLRQLVPNVFQCFDGISNTDMETCEFVGVAVAKVDGLDAHNAPNSSHAATAVRIGGTITAQNPSSEVISPMTPVVWELPDRNKPAEIKGIKPVFLPNIKPLHKARATRIADRIFPKPKAVTPFTVNIALQPRTPSNAYAIDAASKYFLKTMGIPYDDASKGRLEATVAKGPITKDNFSEYFWLCSSTLACWDLNLNPVNVERRQRKQREFLEETIQFVLELVEDDERHKIGICLGTEQGQAHLLLKH